MLWSHRKIVEVQLFSFFNLEAKCGWVRNNMLRPLYTGKDPVPSSQETAWAPGPLWLDTENAAPTGLETVIELSSETAMTT
jgi:hypothetical protein